MSICCGPYFTIAISDDDSVVVFGTNNYYPYNIPLVLTDIVVEVYTGTESSLTYITHNDDS